MPDKCPGGGGGEGGDARGWTCLSYNPVLLSYFTTVKSPSDMGNSKN